MGRLSRASRLREAGELCPVEVIDREGLVVTSEGTLVRVLRAAAKNPLVMSSVEREQIGHAFGQLASRLQAGQSIQFYVEAAPVRLDALLAHSEDDAERAIRALAANGDGRGDALRRLYAALRESLERHADEQAAVDVAYYVVVPYLPDQTTRLDWRTCFRVPVGVCAARRSSGRSRRRRALPRKARRAELVSPVSSAASPAVPRRNIDWWGLSRRRGYSGGAPDEVLGVGIAAQAQRLVGGGGEQVGVKSRPSRRTPQGDSPERRDWTSTTTESPLTRPVPRP